MANENNYQVQLLENDNAVPQGCECPKCGERDADALLLDDDDNVTCQRCGHTYSVAKGD